MTSCERTGTKEEMTHSGSKTKGSFIFKNKHKEKHVGKQGARTTVGNYVEENSFNYVDAPLWLMNELLNVPENVKYFHLKKNVIFIYFLSLL